MTINHQPCYKTPTKKKQKTFRNPETCGRDTSSSITVYTCTCTCMFGSATSYLAGALGLCAVPHSTSIAALVPHILMIFLFFLVFLSLCSTMEQVCHSRCTRDGRTIRSSCRSNSSGKRSSCGFRQTWHNLLGRTRAEAKVSNTKATEEKLDQISTSSSPTSYVMIEVYV